MAQYDGSIRINTSLVLKNLKKDTAEAERILKSTAKSISEMEKNASSTDAFKNIKKQAEEAEKNLDTLKRSRDLFLESGGSAQSPYLKNLNSDIEKAQSRLSALKESMKALTESGMGYSFSSSEEQQAYVNALARRQELTERIASNNRKITELQSQELTEEERLAQIKANATVSDQKIVDLLERRKQLQTELKDLEKAGVTQGYEDFDSRQRELSQINQQIKDYGKSTETAKTASKKLAESARNALSTISKYAKKSSREMASFAASSMRKAVSSMFSFGKSTKSTNNTLEKGFKAVLKYGLGIRSFYILINKFRTAVKEGFKNLAQYSGETNTAISMLKSSLTQLKNSFATAFNPILTAAAPALTALINMVSRAVTYVGMLIAALTGKGTFTKAKEVQEDYAASLDKSADSAKNAKKESDKYLSGLDEVQRYESAKDSDSGDSGGYKAPTPGEMFEEVDIPSQISDFAGKIKDAFSGIWDVFKQSWESKGIYVMNSAKAAFDSLKSSAKSVGSTFYEVFTGGVGLEWAESGLELLRSMLDVIRSISDAFRGAWEGGAGEELVTSIFNMLTKINRLVTSIGDSFSRVFSRGVGTEIWENILGIVTGVYNTVGNLAEQIQKAWDTAGLGDSIWEGILNTFNTILETIHNIADSTAGWAGSLDITPLLQSIDGLLKSLEPLAENIGAGLEWFWNNVLLPIAGWTIQEAVPAFLDMISASIDALNEVIEALKPLGIWLWENFFQPLGQWAGDAIISALETITDLLKKFGDWVSEHQETVQNMAIIIGSFFAAFKIVTAVAGIVNFIAKMGGLIGIVQKMAGLIGTVFNPWTLAIGAVIAIGVLLWKNWDTIKEKAIEIWGAIRDWFKETIEKIKEFFSGLWKGIKETFANVGGWFKEKFEGAFTGIKNAFSSVGDFFSGVWKGIKDVFGNIAGWFKDKFSAAWEAVKNVFSKGGKIFDGIKDGILNGLKAVINALIDGINFVITIPFNGINYALRSIKGVNIMGFTPFSWIQTIDVPQIPRLATGAVIPPNREFLAVLGDQKHGTNIEAPEGLIRKIVREETQGMQSQQGGKAVYSFIAQINRRVVFNEVIEEGKLRQTIHGRNPFELT